MALPSALLLLLVLLVFEAVLRTVILQMIFPHETGFSVGHRRYVKDVHWIRDGGLFIGKR